MTNDRLLLAARLTSHIILREKTSYKGQGVSACLIHIFIYVLCVVLKQEVLCTS